MKFKELTDKIQVWEDWKQRYKEFVPKFINEAKTKTSWEDWDQDIFKEFFEKSANQCVSSLRQGYFNNAEKTTIKENWSELAPLLKTIAECQNVPLLNAYRDIKQVVQKHTQNNKMAATNRLIASLQPNLLCSVVNEAKLKHLMSLLNKNVEDCNFNIGSDWFINSTQVLNYFKDQLVGNDPYELITYPWQSYELLQENISEIHDNDMSCIFRRN